MYVKGDEVVCGSLGEGVLILSWCLRCTLWGRSGIFGYWSVLALLGHVTISCWSFPLIPSWHIGICTMSEINECIDVTILSRLP